MFIFCEAEGFKPRGTDKVNFLNAPAVKLISDNNRIRLMHQHVGIIIKQFVEFH